MFILRKLSIMIILVLVPTLLVGCAFPAPTPIDIPDGTCTLEDHFSLRLIEPEDGAFGYAIESVAGRPPNLRWAFAAECMPGGFRVLVGTDEELNAVVISAEVDSEVRQFQIDVDLEVEREYYWTVELLTGELSIGNPPPFTFQTLPVPEGQPGVIAGRVWEDECDFPGGLIDPDNLPEGCVVVEGGVLADGVRDEDELGIPGVEVHYAKGKCPPTGYGGLASSGPTDKDGYYYVFGYVGTYCVTIVPEDPGNETILLPGTFSYPLREYMPLGTAYTEVTIESDGQIFEDINFGWYYVEDDAMVGIGDSASEGVDTAEFEFLFSCISGPGDACENHYGNPAQQCAGMDTQSPDKCPQSYQDHQAVGVCGVDLGPDIFVEWVPYVVPPAIDPVGECENLLQGTWADLYTP